MRRRVARRRLADGAFGGSEMAVGIDQTLAEVGAASTSAHDSSGGSRSWLVLVLMLAAGWGALFSYSAVFLAEDVPLRSAAQRAIPESLPDEAVAFPLPPELMRPTAPAAGRQAEMPAPEPPAPVPAPRLELAGTNAAVAPATGPTQTAAVPSAPPVERPDYIGTWGPNEAACGVRSRRRGYLPATITAEGARAGRVSCSFHDRTRSGSAWVMAADCTDRTRRWTSQVRLRVDGDRLVWSSARGTSSYQRCSRRAG